MRKTITFLLLSVFVIASCKKEQQDVTSQIPVDTTTTEQPNDESYFLSGLFNQEVSPLHKTSTEFIVNRTATPEDRIVNVSVNGLPANTSAWFDVESAEVPYKNNLHMYFKYAPAGTYPVIVTTRSENYAPKDYKFNVQVKEQSLDECNQKFFKHFVANPQIQSSTPITSPSAGLTIGTHSSNNKMYFWYLALDNDNNGFTKISSANISPKPGTINSYDHVEFVFNCNDGNLTIPEQLVIGIHPSFAGSEDTFKVKGSGSVIPESGKYEITYTSTPYPGGSKTTTYTLRGYFNY